MKRAVVKSVEGFTLVEVLVALAVFGIGTIMLLQLSPRATQYSNHGRLMSTANGLAQAKMEDLIGLPSSDAFLTAGAHEDPDNPVQGVFDRSWVVTPDTPFAGMRRIEVRVSMKTIMPDSVATLVTYF